MKHLLTAIFAAVTLGLGAPAAVAAPAPQTEAESRAAEQWLADLAAWASGYNAVVGRRAETLEWLSNNTHLLIAKLDAGEKASARPFAMRIAEEGRQRLTAEMEAYQALSTEPPTFPLAHLISPARRPQLNTFAMIPDRFGTMMIRTDQAGRDFIEHFVAATSGDPEDATALIGAYYSMAIARTEAGIAMTESLRGMPGTAMYRLYGVVIEGEEALIVWTRFNRAVELGEEIDFAGTAATLRTHAQAIRDQAGEMARYANGELVTIRATPSYASTGMGRIMLEANASFVRSAHVEYRTADVMDAVAVAVETAPRDPAAAQQTLNALADRYDGIMNDRRAEDAARRRLIAQNQG